MPNFKRWIWWLCMIWRFWAGQRAWRETPETRHSHAPIFGQCGKQGDIRFTFGKKCVTFCVTHGFPQPTVEKARHPCNGIPDSKTASCHRRKQRISIIQGQYPKNNRLQADETATHLPQKKIQPKAVPFTTAQTGYVQGRMAYFKPDLIISKIRVN